MALTRASFAMVNGAVVNAKDYGVVGDNNADDTAALQAAITAAAGKTLYIPAGNYKVTAPLTVSNRTSICGDTPMSTNIYYRTTATTTNYLFTFNNQDNIYLSNLSLNCLIGGGSQNTGAIRCNGVSGPVTEIILDKVYIEGFQIAGIAFDVEVYYVSLTNCRFFNIDNSTSNGGTGSTNAIAVYFGQPANAIRLRDCRFGGNNVAIASSNAAQKYSLVINGCYFEGNGATGVGAPTPYDTIELRKWSSVEFTGNYIEFNRTGTNTADSVLRLRSCRGVNVSGNIFAGALGGVAISKNLIGISDNTYGVVIKDNEFQDPVSNYVYVADGNSICKVERNYYDAFGTPVVTYANIMSKMTATLVELDVPLLASVNTGTVTTGNNYQVDVAMAGVPLDRYCTVLATPINAGSDWVVSAVLKGVDTIRLTFLNVSGSDNSFNGTVAIRVLKHGSF